MNTFYTITVHNPNNAKHYTIYYEFNRPTHIRINDDCYLYTFSTKCGYHYERVKLHDDTYEISYEVSYEVVDKKEYEEE